MLFALGLIFIVETWWSKIVWGAVIVISFWDGVLARQGRSAKTRRG
jgi:hypothetical protein